jgi:hypothetical protein
MSDEDPEVMRNRAENAKRLAAEGLPPEIELKRKTILRWNGDPPAPQVTHWTKRGVFIIRAHTPGKTTLVLFGNDKLGAAEHDPRMVALQLFNGAFDKELGFTASEWLPQNLAGWNDSRWLAGQ